MHRACICFPTTPPNDHGVIDISPAAELCEKMLASGLYNLAFVLDQIPGTSGSNATSIAWDLFASDLRACLS
jgi:hypothetical protein